MGTNHIKIVTENRKARHNYFIEETYEAGMVLSYAKIKKGEVFVYQIHIGAYPFAHYGNHDPLRKRKLLLHKYEINKLYGKVNEKGFSLIPLKIYFQNGKAKLTLALARGKRKYDKRESIRRRDEQRDLERSKKEY